LVIELPRSASRSLADYKLDEFTDQSSGGA
jgi:hypothetical protein